MATTKPVMLREWIRAAFELLNRRDAWTQGALARNGERRPGGHPDGEPTDVLGPDAKRFCIVGALTRARGTLEISDDEAVAWRTFSKSKLDGQALSNWNDVKGRTADDARKCLLEFDAHVFSQELKP